MKEEYAKYLKTPIREDRKPLHELLPLNRPLRLLIDPSDICNFRCKFCFQSKQSFHGELMSIKTFDRIIEQLKEFEEPINVVHLYGLGEPLVNRNISYFVKKIKESGVGKEVSITSNGSLLTHELTDTLVKAGLDRMSISLNGLSNDTFKENVGVTVDFDKMYEQICYFFEKRGKCHLHVKINGEQFDEKEKEKFVELFRNCTDSINIDHIVNVWPGLDIAKNDGNRMYDYNLAGLANDNSRKAVCPLMFYELLVHANGSVSPCAVDYEFKKENLGDVYNTTLKEIWFGERLRKIRVRSLRGEHVGYYVCNECQYTECAATVNITPYRENLLKKYEVEE